jgi:hypothetical protein
MWVRIWKKKIIEKIQKKILKIAKILENLTKLLNHNFSSKKRKRKTYSSLSTISIGPLKFSQIYQTILHI